MNPAQQRAILLVDESISFLAQKLMQEYDVAEEEALEVLQEEPELVTKIQNGQLDEIYSNTKIRMVDMPNNPKEFYPGHYAYKAPLTTPDTFNAHVAQAISPYVLAIAKRVAKDRGLEPPSEQEIVRLLEKSDWSRAAYEAKTMTKNPSFPKLRAFLTKYVARPLKKLDDKIPLEKLFGLATSSTMMWIIWATFKSRMYDIGKGPGEAFEKYGDYLIKKRTQQYQKKVYGR